MYIALYVIIFPTFLIRKKENLCVFFNDKESESCFFIILGNVHKWCPILLGGVRVQKNPQKSDISVT